MRANQKRIYLLGAFILLFYSNIHAEIIRLTYRGWEDCYKITNDSLEIIVNASSGGRILVVKKHGVNFMWEDNSIDGKGWNDYQLNHFHPDAGRFDYGPEKITSSIHDMSWAGPWDAEIIDDYTLQISNRDEGLGLLSHRKFTLDPVHPYLKIFLLMENFTSNEKQYWFWGRTLLNLGGKIFAPLNPDSNYPDRWTRYIWSDPVTFASDPDDPGVNIVDSLFTLIPGIAGNSKYGTDAETGWMAYGYKGMIFAKIFDYFKGEPYLEDNNHTHIFYTARSGKFHFVEMEPVSPAVTLYPGESYSFIENWYVFDYHKSTETSFDPLKATGVLFDNLKRLKQMRQDETKRNYRK
jgi:hypothetical protein